MKIRSRYFVAAALLALVAPSVFMAASGKNDMAATARDISVINAVFKEMNTRYVDSVDVDRAMTTAIDAMLNDLDPYTEFISAEEASDFMAMSTTGEYGGIGSVIMMRKGGGVQISDPYEGSPAALAGLRPGDRIVKIDTMDTRTWDTKQVSDHLKGQANTTVHVVVERPYVQDSVLTFDIVRRKIQMPSVPYFTALDGGIGYIQLTKFTETSADEVRDALLSLKRDKAIKSLILDLRGNGGGLVESAIKIANFFVPKNTEIIRTKGRLKTEEKIYKTTQKPIDTEIPLCILVDGGSASASEIVAGSMQDLDRAVVVGSRSFGKGLVQKQIYLPDSSAIRLTIARYYTPSHRCIQKDYTLGDEDDYSKELYDRYTHGELYSADSIKVDKSKIFRTANGRIVYGGGGIVPDIFVPNDTTGITTYYRAVANLGLLQQYVYTYVDINRDQLKNVKTVKQLMGMMPSDDALTYDFVCYARDNGVPMRWYYINLSRSLIARQLRALVIRDVLGSEEFYRYYNRTDNTVNAALKALNDGKGKFPITLTSTKKKKGKR